MSKAWPTVPLGDVLRHRKEFFEIDDTAEYKRCRVQLHAKGIVLRDVVFGADIKTKQQRESRAGEFLVAEIDAKVGGFGIVPTELDGAIVSSHYFLFPIDEQKLERRFLEFFVRTPAFREQVSAQGSTNYAAIRPSHVLGYAIPLPPLAEQRRIVAKIEQLASKIEEARGLRRASVAEAGALERAGLGNVYHQLQETAGLSRLETVCEVITDGDHLTPPFQDEGVAFIFVGNVSTGRLHFDGCKHVTQDYFASLQANRKPRRGDILYSAVGATLGVPVVVDTDRQFCVQRHIAIIKPNHERAASEFLRHMLRSATVFNLAWKWTTGSAQPTIPLRGIRALPVPIPPLPEQRRIVAYLDDLQAKVDQLKALQAQTAAELDALLPSILDKAFRGEL